jgi:hypothetical protein
MAREISIGTFRTREDAEVVRGLLASAGIAARISADDAGGAYPFALPGGVDVVIDEGDRDAAAAILGESADDESGAQ